MGLLGRNGAGKTTLLKLLTGLIRPDAGEIRVRGRVGALIALGAGFDPVLTGRENILINASVLGLSKSQISDQIDQIIDFSELEEFIDTPVRNYSSGMAVRLGFAVASSLKPDVLFADEVLAVGDVGFRAKCYRRISELIGEGVGIVFVSHDISNIKRLCNKCLWLRGGEAVAYGDTDVVSSEYEIWMDESSRIEHRASVAGCGRSQTVKLVRVDAYNENGEISTKLHTGAPVTFEIQYSVEAPVPKIQISFSIRTRDSQVYTGQDSMADGFTVPAEVGLNSVSLHFPELCLGAGEYLISVCFLDDRNIGVYDHDINATIVRVMSPKTIYGRFYMPHTWRTTKRRSDN